MPGSPPFARISGSDRASRPMHIRARGRRRRPGSPRRSSRGCGRAPRSVAEHVQAGPALGQKTKSPGASSSMPSRLRKRAAEDEEHLLGSEVHVDLRLGASGAARRALLPSAPSGRQKTRCRVLASCSVRPMRRRRGSDESLVHLSGSWRIRAQHQTAGVRPRHCCAENGRSAAANRYLAAGSMPGSCLSERHGAPVSSVRIVTPDLDGLLRLHRRFEDDENRLRIYGR